MTRLGWAKMSRSPADFIDAWGVACQIPSDRFSADEKLLQFFDELIDGQDTMVLHDFMID